jgi:hypothetical protein
MTTQPHALTFGGHLIAVPPTHGFVCVGDAGAGKTVAIDNLLTQVAVTGDKVLVYDRTGAYTQRFFREGKDVLLDPLDARFPGWDMFGDVDCDADMHTIAGVLVGGDEADELPAKIVADGARAVICALARKLRSDDYCYTSALATLAQCDTPARMAQMLTGYPEAALMAEEHADDIVAAVNAVGAQLKTVRDGAFSLRDWILTDGDARVFVRVPDRLHTALSPLVATWLEVVIRSVLDGPVRPGRRTWLFLDDFDSLPPFPGLADVLIHGPGHGICHVIGARSLISIDKRFGELAGAALRISPWVRLLLRCRNAVREPGFVIILLEVETDEVATLKDGEGYMHCGGFSDVEHVRFGVSV